MKVQLISDLHLEFFGATENLPKIKHNGIDVLIIAGDLCTVQDRKETKKYLEKVNKLYKKVYYVPGNHEYYQCNFDRANKRLESICKELENVVLLNCQSEVYNGIKFIGCTLWSFVPPTFVSSVTNRVSDYKCITINDRELRKSRKINVQDTNEWHRIHREYLTRELQLAEEEEEKCVVITHHGPILKKCSHPRDIASTTKSAYCSDLSNLFDLKSLKVWCFGHTHFKTHFKEKEVDVFSNPLGYVHTNPRMKPKFDGNFFFEI